MRRKKKRIKATGGCDDVDDDMIISRERWHDKLNKLVVAETPENSNYWSEQGLSSFTASQHLLFCPACCGEEVADIGVVSPPSSRCPPASLCHCGGVAQGRSLTNTGCVRGWALRRSLTSTTISARVCRVILLVRGRVGLCHRDTGLPRHHTGASRHCPVRSLHNYSRSLVVTSQVATPTHYEAAGNFPASNEKQQRRAGEPRSQQARPAQCFGLRPGRQVGKPGAS